MPIPLGAGSGIGSDLLVPLGGGAAILAMLGMLLILPLYIAQRREVGRLLDWRERHPEAGDDGRPDPATDVFTSLRGAGPMTPAERVTSERPALERIGTAERAAIELENAPFWRRVIVRGPRHPLVISILALLLAAAVFAAAALLIRGDDGDGTGKRVDKTAFSIVVVNASPFPGLAGNVADELEAAKFTISANTSAPDTIERSVVRFAPGFQREARAVARRLEVKNVLPFDSESQAAAEDAAIVVVVAQDLAEGGGTIEGDDGGKSGKK